MITTQTFTDVENNIVKKNTTIDRRTGVTTTYTITPNTSQEGSTNCVREIKIDVNAEKNSSIIKVPTGANISKISIYKVSSFGNASFMHLYADINTPILSVQDSDIDNEFISEASYQSKTEFNFRVVINNASEMGQYIVFIQYSIFENN